MPEQLSRNAADRVQEAYQHLLVPIQHGTSPVTWEKLIVQGNDNPMAKAAQKLRDDSLMTDAFSPKILCQEMQQNNLWKGSNMLSVRDLWDYYTKYLYLYRLTDFSVLKKSLEVGVKSGDYFAYADGQDDYGRYLGLCLGDVGQLQITEDGFLIDKESAKAQIEKDNLERAKPSMSQQEQQSISEGTNILDGTVSADEGQTELSTPPVKKNTHFYGSVKIDTNTLGSTAGTINSEVIRHMSSLPGAQVNITLDIQITVPDGIPDDITRSVRENCQTLRFESSEFGEG